MRDLNKSGSSDYLGGCPVSGVDFSRHDSDVQWLQGDIAIYCNAPARRSGGRLCWEATGQGISWTPMRQGRVSPWLRFSARGLFRNRHIGHRSHASVNPYAVRQSEIPPNSRMNHKNLSKPGGSAHGHFPFLFFRDCEILLSFRLTVSLEPVRSHGRQSPSGFPKIHCTPSRMG